MHPGSKDVSGMAALPVTLRDGPTLTSPHPRFSHSLPQPSLETQGVRLSRTRPGSWAGTASLGATCVHMCMLGACVVHTQSGRASCLRLSVHVDETPLCQEKSPLNASPYWLFPVAQFHHSPKYHPVYPLWAQVLTLCLLAWKEIKNDIVTFSSILLIYNKSHVAYFNQTGSFLSPFLSSIPGDSPPGNIAKWLIICCWDDTCIIRQEEDRSYAP